MEWLFVYGTLRKGFSNHHLLGIENQVEWNGDKDSVFGRLYIDDKSGLPYLYPGNDCVIGEVYKIDDLKYLAIKRMELDAGYIEKLVTTRGGYQVNCFFAADDSHRIGKSITDFAAVHTPVFEKNESTIDESTLYVAPNLEGITWDRITIRRDEE